jgi:hypothetical protein
MEKNPSTEIFKKMIAYPSSLHLRIFYLFVILSLLLPGPAPAAVDKNAEFTIFFSGNVIGELDDCG